jgi:hypothetical protein
MGQKHRRSNKGIEGSDRHVIDCDHFHPAIGYNAYQQEVFMKTPVSGLVSTLCLIGFLLSGCAFDLADVRYSPVTLQSQAEPERSFTLTRDVYISQAPCWYSRTLRSKTRWEFVGAITQGGVYRSRDQTLTVECSNVFEAYLVVSGGRLVGFFLPVENGFVAIAEPIELPLEH